MAINVYQYQQNVHLCHHKQECKDAIGPVWDGPCIFNAGGWLSEIFVIVNSMVVCVAVTNNLWIFKPHHLPVDLPFYITATYIQGIICCHQHHDVIWLLHSMNMEVLAIHYSINIAYLLPSMVFMSRSKLTHGFWFLVPTRRCRKITQYPQSTL